ncbi:hypothetical protein [Salinimicrobium xinjiangense]|uniref:hypothetical protein n=1 Tax=Salinimicrobium xinjiangense TaxID=438596 RepID=UPI00056B3FD2|nr:hypothetical protein [Salinimicrobium xinjiangense]
MTKRHVFFLLGVLLGIVILTNLPFLPGPNFLNTTAQVIYNGGQMMGILGLLLIPIGLILTIQQFRKSDKKIKIASLLLWSIPLTVLLSTSYLSYFTRDFSRSFAIKRTENLIKQIEAFKEEHGYYPEFLEYAGIKTPSTGIIGIGSFYYQGDSANYELTFYQNVILSFNYEIVTYDKTGRHSAKGEMEELYETGFDHWKYEIFD